MIGDWHAVIRVETDSGRMARIVFYDLETTIPLKKGDQAQILEFAAVTLSIQGLAEVDSFATFVRPITLAAVSQRSTKVNGITVQDVENAPTFADVADRIFSILDGQSDDIPAFTSPWALRPSPHVHRFYTRV